MAFGGPGGMQAFRQRCGKTSGFEIVHTATAKGLLQTTISQTSPQPTDARCSGAKRAIQHIALPSIPSVDHSAITAPSGLTKASRQALVQQQRQAALAAHIKHQKLCLPVYRKFYQHLIQYGGCAMACDVESWTEDADVLLELGLAWKKWVVKEGRGSIASGSEHYSALPPASARQG